MKKINLCNYKWYVLEEQDGKALLFAKDIITQKAYHETYEPITWGKCTLRRWLKYEFYPGLEKCHANILDTETEPGIIDNIFLLSIEEYKKYDIPPVETWWWLRTRGGLFRDHAFALSILNHGRPYDRVVPVNNASGGVRPAMWVDTK